MTNNEKRVVEIFEAGDLTLDLDLFGHYYVHNFGIDFMSPAFPSMQELTDWLIEQWR
jgi:hypothetical protein